MNKRLGRFVYLITALIAGLATSSGQAQDHPTIIVQGKTYTPDSIYARNRGPGKGICCDETTPWPPHKIIDNIYYVGTKTLSSFLIVTPAGNILMNSTWEQTLPLIRKSVEGLGFKFTDIKILLNNQDASDQVTGDAMVKEWTGAQVVTMAEGVPGMKKIMPGGKEHPIDRIIHDGDTVTLGGTTLVAHLTPGHTHGGTTWTMTAKEGEESYNVVFFNSLRIPDKLTPDIVAEFNRTFPLMRSLPCDVPLSDHAEVFDIQEKIAAFRSNRSGPNPFIDHAGCALEVDVEDSMFHAMLKEQGQAPPAPEALPASQ